MHVHDCGKPAIICLGYTPHSGEREVAVPPGALLLQHGVAQSEGFSLMIKRSDSDASHSWEDFATKLTYSYYNWQLDINIFSHAFESLFSDLKTSPLYWGKQLDVLSVFRWNVWTRCLQVILLYEEASFDTVSFLFGLIFGPEDRGNTFLQTPVVPYRPDYRNIEEYVNSVTWVGERAIPTERPPNLRMEGATWSSWRIPYCLILAFLHQNHYFFQVTPQLYSRGRADPVPDSLLFRKSVSTGNRTRSSGSIARNSVH
jgi:hypothetical protein